MKTSKKKWLSRALCTALAVTLTAGTAVMTPVADIVGTNITANAAYEGYTAWTGTGTDADGNSATVTCYWKVDNGTLYVAGTAPNTGGNQLSVPWCKDSNISPSITKVCVEEGTKTSADAGYLFFSLPNAASMDLSNLDTSAATNMKSMFYNCKKLTTLNLSSWHTSKVTNMTNLFSNCTALTSLNLNGWKTSSVTSMECMFNTCESLTSLDLSGLDTSSVTNMTTLFTRCSKLTSLNLNSWKTSSVTSMRAMFQLCKALISLDVSGWNISSVTDMSLMFGSCTALASLDLSGWDTQNVTTMSMMFNYCTSLATIYVGNGWNTDKITSNNSYSMFSKCTSLVGGKGTTYDSSKIDKTYAHIDGGTSNPGYFTQGVVKPKTYTVTWKNYDGTTLETDQNVEEGTTPSYDGATPTKTSTAQYSYTFSGWDKEITTVTGDVTYTAQFTETTNTYTVNWKNEDGTVLETDTVEYGKTPEYNGETPTKEGNAQYSYTFSGWDKEITAVTGNATYTAQFTETTNTYTVTWVDGDGNTTTDTIGYGTTPSYDGEKPTKASDKNYIYKFRGWTDGTNTYTAENLPAVNGDVTYTAVYDRFAIIHEDDVFVNSTESTPEVVVTDPFTKEILTEGTDYTVKANNSTVTVTGINSYAGGVQKSYTTLSRDMKASITNRRKTGTNAKATLSGEWYLPKNATNIQAGIARLSTDDTAVTNYDVYKNGVKKASALKTTSGKYSFSLLMNSTHANQNLYTVTYVTYEIDGVPFVSISKAFTGYPNPA